MSNEPPRWTKIAGVIVLIAVAIPVVMIIIGALVFVALSIWAAVANL
jgi:hypothetical protein